MHNFLRAKGRDNRVVLHTHPTDIIGMTHCKPFLDSEKITRTLWSMIPECRIIVPKGVGIVPYEIPGTLAVGARYDPSVGGARRGVLGEARYPCRR